MKKVIFTLSIIGTLLTVGCASTSETVPMGLNSCEAGSGKHSAAYMKPEANLDIYAEFAIVPCQVAFRKNW